MDTVIFINMGYIYLLIDKRNKKKYIGKHNNKKDQYFTSGIIPSRIIKKYGKEIFERIILEDNIIDDEINKKEIFYIKKYDTFNNGYNLTKGGDGGNKWELKKTKEELDIIAEIKRNKNLGRKFSNETLEKMSKSKKGKKLSEQHKLNIKNSQSGKNHPWFGRKHKEDSKKKISNSKIGKKNRKHSEYMKHNNPRNRKISIDGVIFDSIQMGVDKLEIPRHVLKKMLTSKNFPNCFKI